MLICCEQDECSFVSLRDVLRVLDVMAWFLEHEQPLFRLMDEKLLAKVQQDAPSDDEEDEEDEDEHVCDMYLLIC